MSGIFLKIVNMSISAGWLILAVLALRLILRKAPRWVHVLLWGIVAVRLVCPFSIESVLSLIPSTQTISPEIMMDRTPEISTGIASLDRVVNPVISTTFAPEPIASANPLQILIPVAANLWLLGVLVMLLYTAGSYLILRGKLRMAVVLTDNIFQCETVRSPFVLGILKPRIYLPYSLGAQELAHVVAHEQAHISRKDHWWKPLGFLLLTLHWFNPLMWAGYILLCRDIELACDEKVIARLGNDQRADYTQALVACSVNRFHVAACPLAFGEVGVKERVKNVLNYRKPAFWVVVLAVVLCGVVAVCFLTDPAHSREFAMAGNNVADLDPWEIQNRIVEMEGLEDISELEMNSQDFDIHLTGDFEWDNSQAIRFVYTRDQQTFDAQLRVFPEDDKFFVTEAEEATAQEEIFKLHNYLFALKYLPQEAIREMCPDADGYILTHRVEGTPDSYPRVITYSLEGAMPIDGWFIHLELQPLHDTGDGALHGTGEEVIHLFYGAGKEQTTTTMLPWIDYEEMDLYNLTEQTIQLPEFEGVTFHYNAPASVSVEDRTGENTLIQGMPILNVIFTDVTGDGMPDVCATVSFGSGLVDTHVVVYDYVGGQEYTLWDRGVYDYYLRTEDGKLLCEQRSFLGGGINKGDLLATGELILVEAGGGGGKRLTMDFGDVKPGGRFIVNIVDRAETEQLPTDEAVEVFWEDAEFTYSFPSIRSHLVMVTYNNGNSEDIKTALESGRASIRDLELFGIRFYTEPRVFSMVPTRTNLRGLVNGYLFIPINGATYRYLLTDPRPQNVTAEALLDSFADETDIEGIAWDVYSLKEYPDKTKLLMVSGTNSTILCEYAPAQQAEEGALEAAREAGYVIVEDGTLTANAEVWTDFYEACQRGNPGFITIAQYLTLDPERTDPETYAAYQEDYPALYIHELSYDGEEFVLRTESDVRVYKYLMKYTASGTPLVNGTEHELVDRYVLTHDNTHTWDQLWQSLASSAAGAAIDHYTVCAVEN